MVVLKLKEEYENTVIGYNGSGKPLGQRDDYAELLRLSSSFRKYFEDAPTGDELKEYSGEKFLEELKGSGKKSKK